MNCKRMSKASPGTPPSNYGQLSIDGQIVPAFGLDQERGTGYLHAGAGGPRSA